MNYALIPRDRAAKRSSALHEMRTNRIVGPGSTKKGATASGAGEGVYGPQVMADTRGRVGPVRPQGHMVWVAAGPQVAEKAGNSGGSERAGLQRASVVWHRSR